MNEIQIWAQLSGLAFFAGVWVTISGIVLMLISMAMHVLGIPK